MNTASTAPAVAAWNVDPTHSGVEFSVRHFFTPVRGKFEAYEAELSYDPENPAASRVSVTIDVTSIDTGNEDRDAHLLSADFFDAERYPTITFESDEVRVVSDDEIVVAGPLTIRDRTHRVELPVTIQGVKDLPAEMQEMFGGVEQVASFTTRLGIDRSDYGVGTGSWAAALVVGHEVDIDIAVEANR